MGAIEVDLFSEEVDGANHPEAIRFKRLLEDVAEGYNCTLLSFDVERGTVSFFLDDNALTAEIIKILQDEKSTKYGLKY